MSPVDFYDKVNSLQELKEFLERLGGAEGSNIELKSVYSDLNGSDIKPVEVGDFKLLLAKEFSAFANTDGGVIAVGVDEDLRIKNSTQNLYHWLDKNIRHLVEPQLSGIKLKRCSGQGDEEFVMIYVPKGKVVPYRVAAPAKYERKKDLAREYFQRIGTHSERIPSPIVRSLYLSNDRATDISVNTVLLEVDRQRSIKLGIEVSPDPARLITKYYLETSAMLLDKNFKPLLDEDIDLSMFLGEKYPIPPEDKASIFHEHLIAVEQPGESRFLPLAGETSIGSDVAGRVYAIYVKTEFACDGVPKQVKDRIILIGYKDKITEDSWNEASFWVNEKCEVVRYISISNDNIEDKHSLEGFIERSGLS